MRIEEIRAIAAEFNRTNNVVRSLCQELLNVHAINDRMAQDISTLMRENADLRELSGEPILEGEPLELGDDEPITDLNTQLYGVP